MTSATPQTSGPPPRDEADLRNRETEKAAADALPVIARDSRATAVLNVPPAQVRATTAAGGTP